MLTDQELVSSVVAKWRNGAPPVAVAVIAEHPELHRDKSLVIQLAYEEFCLRAEAGEKINLTEFCERFPSYRKSLARLLEVHDYFVNHPEIMESVASATWPKSGDSILGFLVEREIGRGGLARVYLARERALSDRIVVIKVSRSGRQEAETLGKLIHPNIVPIHSVQYDSTTGLTVACMPYVGQATLCDVIDCAFCSGTPPKHSRAILDAICIYLNPDELRSAEKLRLLPEYVDAVVGLSIQLAAALSYTHSMNVLHRDLKPSNVLVTPSGQAMLLDFNLSTDLISGSGVPGGTVPYMAPEQLWSVFIAKDHQPIGDPRSDIYSLGAVLYELLTGHTPFADTVVGNYPTSENVKTLLQQIDRGPTSIRELNPDVHPRLAAIVRRCLQASPGRRFQSCDELASALRQVLTPFRRLIRRTRRHAAVLISVGIVLLFSVLLTAYFLVKRPSFAQREFDAGLNDYKHADYAKAIQHFNQTLSADPNSASCRFARALSAMHIDDFTAAIADLESAHTQSRNGKISACLAYCYGQLRSHPKAILAGQQAIAAGFQTAPVLNNLGYSYLQSGRLSQAKRCFDAAIEADSSLGVVYQNRLVLDIRQLIKSGEMPIETLTDVDTVVAQNPLDPKLLFDVACAYAIIAKQDSELTGKVIQYLTSACDHGLDPALLGAEPLFEIVRQQPSFQSLLQRHATTAKAHTFSPLVVPCESVELN